MASIRIGFFEDFEGADTLLLDVDREGLNALIAWLQTATSSDRRTSISSCPGCIVQAGVAVDLLRAADDTGLVRAAGPEFVGGRYVADRSEQSARVEPVDPRQRGKFDGLEMVPRSLPLDDFRLEEPDDRFRHGIVVGVAATADRRRDPGVGQSVRVPHRQILRAASL